MDIWRFGRSLAPCALAFAAAVSPVSADDCQFVPEPVQISAPITFGEVHQQPVAKMAFAEWRRQQLAGRAAAEQAGYIESARQGQTPISLVLG